jgi:SAM-dependent methyltransferase
MHPEARAFVAALAPGQAATRVVELGARDFNGSVRDLFPGAAAYTGVDLLPGAGVDVVADASEWRPPPGQPAPDLVLCCEVLEHTRAASAVVRNAHALLAPGGRLVVTAASTGRPAHSALDGGPLRAGEYYRNVDRRDLAGWLLGAGFALETLEFHPSRGDVYALARKDGTP